MTGRLHWLMTAMRQNLIAKASAELLGCLMFHFIGSLSPTPEANGVALMTAVYYAAKVSGAHLNPAVTAAFCFLGFTNPLEAVVYIVAQIAGCVGGALLLAVVVPGCRVGEAPGALAPAGCFLPRDGLSLANVFGWETIGTLMFITPVMSVVWYTQNKSGYGNTGPIMVGISLYAVALAVGGWTGASLNPARSLGSALVFKCAPAATTVAYIAGQALGALLVPLFVIPWYGISNTAWYLDYLSAETKTKLRSFLPSIEHKTIDRVAAP